MKVHTTVNEEENGNVYLNVEVNNTTEGLAFGAILTDNLVIERTDAILLNPSEYNAAIVRFNLNGGGLPLLIAPIQANQSDPLLTTLSVTIESGGFFFREFLIFVPYFPQGKLKPSNPQPQDTTSDFYFIYDYQNMADMFNTAINTAYVASGGLTADSPFLVWKEATRTFDLICTISIFALNEAVTPVKIYINNDLGVLLSSFALIQNLLVDPTNGAELLLNINLTGDNYYQTQKGLLYPPLFLAFKQQWISVNNWTAFKSIVFISEDLPTVSEIVGQNNDTQRVLTDFIPDFETPSEGRNNLKFDSQGEYRLYDMVGTTPLYRFCLGIFWKNVYGDLIPFDVGYLQSFSIKFLFEPKSYKTGL